MSDAKPLTMTTNVTAAGSSYIYNLTVSKEKIKVTGVTAGAWTASGTTTGDLVVAGIPYVTFKAEQPQTFKMTAKGGYKITGLQYSVNYGEWKTVAANEEVTFGGTNGTLRLRGTNTNGTASAWSGYSTITFTDKTVKVACTGDIRTLLDWRIYSTVNTQNAKFSYLFYDCSVLTSAPELPATTLADNCYQYMFNGCTSLTSAPELPATKLAEDCYYQMFSGCTNLTAAPELPATTLENSCYRDMFRSCTKLTSAPELPATTLADFCYYGMFEKCTNLTSAPELPANTLKLNCYNYMFSGCTNLASAPELPATILANYCYFGMFEKCTNLTSAPELPATVLAEACYGSMFSDCTKLSTVTMLALDSEITSKSDCVYNWLGNAGTDKNVNRTLIVKDEAAYNALVNTKYLPDNWKKDATNTTVEYYTPKQ